MSEQPEPLSAWEAHLSAPLRGRKVVCAFQVLAGMTSLVDLFQRYGMQRSLLIADGVGTGPLPDPADADVLLLDAPPASTLTEQVRGHVHPGERLSPQVVAAVESYDPNGTALWWSDPVADNSRLLEREVWGGRPARHISLEDKLLIDSLLTGAEIDQAGGARVVAVHARATYDDLTAASEQVLAGHRHRNPHCSTRRGHPVKTAARAGHDG